MKQEQIIVIWYGTHNFNFNCTLGKMEFFSDHFCIMAKIFIVEEKIHLGNFLNEPLF